MRGADVRFHQTRIHATNDENRHEMTGCLVLFGSSLGACFGLFLFLFGALPTTESLWGGVIFSRCSSR